ncbi:haloacid dehalogenase [Roridomyces roridus]|uniref:Haloacid dehalogenase n=1 Tax=Roridomyces roridus TaxID=1738132 RepID=A0AAD7BC16_9AGAR|nr:haloacid dehalogenase [Roridomyces roridus]
MSPLDGVQALLFDVFGTVVDWRGSVIKELEETGRKYGIEGNWAEFAQTWRTGYLVNTRRIAEGGAGASSVDVMHREILDEILATPEWKKLGDPLGPEERAHLNLSWHRLRGWPDTVEGLYALKKQLIIATLSNGNIRLLVDMAKFADLPWDTVFSAELFQSFKPNPKVYLGAAAHLSLPPENCAMVAAHIYDLRAAAALGFKTVYIRRAGEGGPDIKMEDIKSKADGGEVDVVVDSFVELARILHG